MGFKELAKTALWAIKSNLLRSLLTILAISIGISSVVILNAFSESSKNTVQNAINSLGADVFIAKTYSSSSFNKDIAEYVINQGAGHIDSVSAVVLSSSDAEYQGSTYSSVSIIGADTNYYDIAGIDIIAGSGAESVDETLKSKSIVISKYLADDIFSSYALAVGQTLVLGSGKYEIIGVYDQSDSYEAIMPLSRAQASFTGFLAVDSLYFKAVSADDVDLAIAEAEIILGQFVDSDNISISNSSNILSVSSDAGSYLTTLLIFIACISLVVSAIGVMNIMLVSVKTRIKEIGIRKSLGATKTSILMQFLFESSFLCFFGALLGIIFSLMAAIFEFNSIRPVPSLDIIVISAAASIIIGLFFGAYPAYKASCIDPSDALKA